jgi:hypothetical protein
MVLLQQVLRLLIYMQLFVSLGTYNILVGKR